MAQDAPLQFAVMVGSLRKSSFNAAIARSLPQLAPERVTIEPLPPIGEFPLYNYDVQQQGFPPIVTRTGEAIRKADGVIIVTPGCPISRSPANLSRFRALRRAYSELCERSSICATSSSTSTGEC